MKKNPTFSLVFKMPNRAHTPYSAHHYGWIPVRWAYFTALSFKAM